MAAEVTQNQKAHETAKSINGMQFFILGRFVRDKNVDQEKIVKDYNLDKIDFYNAFFKLTNDRILTIDKRLSVNATFFGNQVFEEFPKMDDQWHKNMAIEVLYHLRRNVKDRSHQPVCRVLGITTDELGITLKEMGLRL